MPIYFITNLVGAYSLGLITATYDAYIIGEEDSNEILSDRSLA